MLLGPLAECSKTATPPFGMEEFFGLGKWWVDLSKPALQSGPSERGQKRVCMVGDLAMTWRRRRHHGYMERDDALQND